MKNIESEQNITLYPLTHPQKRIWYIENIYPGTSLYNIGGTVTIKGEVDFTLLENAINYFIRNNDGVRLRFLEKNEEIYQYIHKYEYIKLDCFDFCNEDDPEEEYKKWVEKVSHDPFSLMDHGLFYFAMFKISDHRKGYLVKFHHIIADGWSMNVMTEQICDTYTKLSKGDGAEDIPFPSYVEYMAQEKSYLLSDRFIKNRNFWNRKFQTLPEASMLQSSDIIEGRRKTFVLEEDISGKIKAFVSERKYSVNTFFVALYIVYLNKTRGLEDVVLGTPVLNRSGKKEKSMFGMFTSTVPFRYRLEEEESLEELMGKVNEQLMECYFNQKYPYDVLVQDLQLKKKGYDNLFDICVNYYNTRLNTELNGYPVENLEFYNGNQVYSLQLIIREWTASRSLTLDFDYKVNDYSAEEIGHIYDALYNLIQHALSHPHKKISQLCLLSDRERQEILYDFNGTASPYPKDRTIYELFEEQAEKSPDKIAIAFKGRELTFQELNACSNQLARQLVEKGVKKDTIVGILATHSIETVAAILAVLKAGGAYLPIDPGYPAGRIEYMLENSGSNILITNCEKSSEISFRGLLIDLNCQELFAGDGENLGIAAHPEDLVYVIYTSGSTGKPKGTMIEHRGLVNYIWWAKEMYVKDENEVFALYSSLAFDLTVTSVFTPLISGSKIVVYRDDEDEYVLYRIMRENLATVVKLTPSHLSLIKGMDNRNSSVKRFIVGGEDLKVSLAYSVHQSFGGNIEIYNEYGPTETVVGCMIHLYQWDKDRATSVPIGIPADNVQIYILDKGHNPLPVGAAGEMYIGGDGVARGYLNRPELTAEKFLADPFFSGGTAGRRMYRTGDSARFLPEGKIEYIGRIDQQIKIRGYRIELGEIEAHLIRHKAVKAAVVIALEDENKSKYLCAYVVKSAQVSSKELWDGLSQHLPDYMIPSYFIEIDEIPLTANGKVDAAALPKPEIKTEEQWEDDGFVNEKQQLLMEVLKEILNIEKISLKSNFYHQGGDSIKAIQIASRLYNKGFKIKVKDILSHPTIEEMALYMEGEKARAIDTEPCEGSIIRTPIVAWFLSRKFKNPNHYNQSVFLEMKQDIGTEVIGLALDELIKHHDVLRVNYDGSKDELFYHHGAYEATVKIEAYDLSSYSYEEQKREMCRIGEAVKSSFDIEKDILIKACLFDLGAGAKRLLLTAHHLVVDGVSWRIILEDMAGILKQAMAGEKITLPLKTSSMQQWAKRLEEYGREEALKEQSYWQSVVEDFATISSDFSSNENTLDSTLTKGFQLTEQQTEDLLLKAIIPYGTEVKDLLLTALALAVYEDYKIKDFVVELEGHGREELFEDMDISRTVGWFTSIYPLKLSISTGELSAEIKSVKEQLRRVPNNGIGFGVLKYMSGAELDYDGRECIRFNYLGDFGASFDAHVFGPAEEKSGSDSSRDNGLTALIDINAMIVNKKLNIEFTYSMGRFREDAMEGFVKTCLNKLEALTQHCCAKEDIDFTPSDFETAGLTQDELDGLFS